VLIFENAALYNLKGELADPPPTVDIASAAVRRAGTRRQPHHLRRLALQDPRGGRDARQEGIDAEVLDLRVLRPLDDEAILATRCARRTAR
jgi:pyruvate/2-oxoglutarate/acetoin dehydrogenase E1 component